MSDIYEDIFIDLVLPANKAGSQKQMFRDLAAAASQKCSIPEQTIFDRLMDRERLASSGIGDGVAIPHLKFRRLQTPITALLVAETPASFRAVDDLPVDIVYMLLSPDVSGPVHLRRLSRITRFLRNHEVRRRIREAGHTGDAEALRSIFIAPEGWLMAA